MTRIPLLARLGLTALALAFVSTPAQCQDAVPATIKPVPKQNEEWWMKLHQSFLDRAKKKDVDLLFLGDSITQGWGENATWKRYYGPRQTANFGISGDRTQHVLWRLENGEIEGINPRVAVLMIGTNNIGSDTPEEIAEGVKTIVTRLREKLPTTKVLVLGVFPRAMDRSNDFIKKSDQAKPSETPVKINEMIAKLDDGKMVHYLDITKSFLNEEGNIPKTLMPDYLHLSDAGYRVWAESIEPTLWDLMQ